jgi:microcystin-dependent protein
MSDQFLGEIRMVGFNFAPVGWALCNGQILPLSQNTALFSLLGTTYGGDGRSTFALPNFQGLAPISAGNGNGLSPRVLGETGGQVGVSLTTNQAPAHTHPVNCIPGAGTQNSVSNAVWASAPGDRNAPKLFTNTSAPSPMNAAAVQNTGAGQAHNNLPPYLSVYFVIALQGIYPPRG